MSGKIAVLAGAFLSPADVLTPANGWPLRRAARRIAWHLLDHRWDIEDKS